MKRRGWRILSACLSLAILVAVTVPVFADQNTENHKKVTVAYMEQEGLMEKDEDGKLSGYTYDYIMKLAQYANWDVEFVFPESEDMNEYIVEMMDKVAEGKVDIISAMVYNEALAETYAYPVKSYGYAFTTLVASKSNTTISEDNLFLKKDLKVAMTEKADTRNEELDAFCKSNNIEYTVINCADDEEQLEAVKSGKADVMVSLNLLPLAGTKIVASFADRPFYLASQKSNTELCEEIDRAINAIDYAEPDFRKELHDKYFSNKEGESTFSKDGLAYIKEKKSLKILVPEDIKPLQSKVGGEFSGIFVSFSKRLAEVTGMEVELYSLPEKTTLKEAMASGNYDMTLAVPEDYEWADDNGLIFSVPLLTSDKVLYYNKSAEISDLSKLKGSKIQNLEEGLESVEKGESDYGYGSSLVVNYILSSNAYQQVAILPVAEENSNYVCAFSKDASIELIAIVNEVIENIDPATMNAFILDSSQLNNQDLLTSWIRKNPIGAMGFVCVFAILIISLVAAVVVNRKKREENVMLLKANNAKSEFLSKMSHEMRTPLNAIIGLTALAQDETNNPKAVKSHLCAIDDSSDYLLRLINDILDMAKIESGEFELVPSVYWYEDFKRTISIMVEPLCKQKNIEFVCDYQLEEESVIVDKLRLDQIFINLLTNAVKFTPENGQVKFLTKTVNDGNGYLDATFIIIDNGVGMSEEFQNQLFEPFAQECSDGTNGGTGLGLAISKKIVDMMDGEFIVESEKDKGTKITITMKLKLAPREKHEATHQVETVSNNTLRDKKLLLVEDNDMNRDIAKRLLEKRDVRVECAFNGLEAVTKFEESEEGYYDGILMDIRMPEMDGLTATAIIRNMDRRDAKEIPIIAMTADAFAEDVEKARSAGISGYLAKPVNVKLLYETLEKTL